MPVEQLSRDRVGRSSNGEFVTGPKTILVHVHDDEGLQNRVALALSLARAYGAHLQFLHVIPAGAYLTADGMGTIVCEIGRVLEEEADKLRLRLETQLARAKVSWEYQDVTDDVTQAIIRRASLVDLVLVGHEPRAREFGDAASTTIASLLRHCRAPIMVAGAGDRICDLSGRATVAWNGSIEAADALRAAISLLQSASAVDLMCVGDDEEDQLDASLALAYLSHHGVHAKRVYRPQCFDDVADDLVDYAISEDVSMIVMGGYSHSRAGEFLFGGVTRRLLLDCPVSLVLSR